MGQRVVGRSLSCCRPREGGDPYAVSKRCVAAYENRRARGYGSPPSRGRQQECASRTQTSSEVVRLSFQTITVDVSARRIATITLNRPDRGNAFDQTMLDELADQLKTLGSDDNVRIVVLRGSGRHFCTGADLASRGGEAPAQPPARAPASLRDVLIALDTLPKPTMAVVHGGAVGGGAGFVTCCDVAIATEAAFFSIPEVRIGMPPFGVMPFLIRAMGHRPFRRYGLSGERIAANEALQLGLVHQGCEAATVEETAAPLATD